MKTSVRSKLELYARREEAMESSKSNLVPFHVKKEDDGEKMTSPRPVKPLRPVKKEEDDEKMTSLLRHPVKKEEDGEKITLTVKTHEGQSFRFSMRRDEAFLGLKTAFCESLVLGSYEATRFTCKGRTLCCRDTPDDFDIEDGEVIVAVPRLRGC